MTETQPGITPIKAWMLASRPKTLPAAFAPVAVGIGVALADGVFEPVRAFAALMVALLLQVAVNLANDYFDYVKGVDSAERKGPMRVTQSGLIAPERVRLAMILVIALAALFGGYLIVVGGVPVIVIGVVSILATLAYSGGPYPLASHGLGDVFVFIFFGLVAVCGTYYVQALALPLNVLISAIPPGFLITAILIVNNLRDIDTDREVGKNTLAVILGKRGSLIEYIVLVALAYIIPAAQLILHLSGWWVLLVWASLPLAFPLFRILRAQPEDGAVMNKALAGTARLALIFSILYAVGLALS